MLVKEIMSEGIKKTILDEIAHIFIKKTKRAKSRIKLEIRKANIFKFRIIFMSKIHYLISSGNEQN